MITATVRCWPNGRVIPAADMKFAAPPLVGDVIEITDFIELLVRDRRFAADGRLILRCDPLPGSGYDFDALQRAFDEARAR